MTISYRVEAKSEEGSIFKLVKLTYKWNVKKVSIEEEKEDFLLNESNSITRTELIALCSHLNSVEDRFERLEKDVESLHHIKEPRKNLGDY